MKKTKPFFILLILITTLLVGCGNNDDTIQTCIISNISYPSQSELETATQIDTLTANESIYASIHFVESPKGMKYTVKWYLDGTEIKSETKSTVNDTQDVVVYELEAEQAVAGTLKVEVLFKNTVLQSQELKIQ